MLKIDPAELERTRRALEDRQDADRRAEICACGHPMGKHSQVGGRAICNALKATCPCTQMVAVLKAPNARVFSYKTDEAGHAIVKGVMKTLEMGQGEKLEAMINMTCREPGCTDDETVTFCSQDGGRTSTVLCREHR